MKKLLAILLLSYPAWATTAFTGHIGTLGTTSVTSNTFVRFWLRGCGGNQPRVGATAIIAPTQGGVFFFDFPANSTGDVSGNIYSNRDLTGLSGGEIECGGSHTATWYGMQIFYAGKGGPETPILAKDTDTFDISNITPITTAPVVTAPNGDSTYARLDAGNQPFTGNVTPSGNGVLALGATTNRWDGFFDALDVSGLGTFSGTVTHSGAESFKNLNSIRFADQYAGADCGAKIVAADADLGGTGGIIAVSQACGLTISTAITLNANHKLWFIQPGSWSISAAITLLDKAGIEGVSPTINEDILNTADPQTVLKQAASTNLAQIILIKGQNVYLKNLAIDGNGRGGGNGSTVGVKFDNTGGAPNNRGRFRADYLTVEDCGSDGMQITSDTSGNNQAISPFIEHSAFNRNGGNGITVTRTTDTHISKTNFELNAGYGVRAIDSPGWIYYSDLSSNNPGQFYASYDSTASSFAFMQGGWGILFNGITTTALGSGLSDLTGSSVVINGYNGTSCGMGSESLIAGNSISVQTGLQDGTVDAIRLVDTNSDRVINNAIISGPGGSNRWKYGIDNTHSGSCATVNGTLVSGNTIVNNYTSGYYNLNSATDSEQNTLATSVQTQRKRTAGCATAASANATCDTTVTWVQAFQDTNYTVTCSGNAATSGVPMLEGISISAGKSASAVTVRTLAQTAAAAQFTNIECVAVHD